MGIQDDAASIQSLARRVKMLSFAAAAQGAVIAALLMGGQGTAPPLPPARQFAEEVSARRFKLLDSRGEVCGEWRGTEDGVSFSMLDDRGVDRAMISVTEGGAAVALIDRGGVDRARMTLTEAGPAVSLLDDKGRERARAAVGAGGATFSAFDEERRAVWSEPSP